MFFVFVLELVLFLGGCATGGGGGVGHLSPASSGPQLSAKANPEVSKTYLDGVLVVRSDSKDLNMAFCSLPASRAKGTDKSAASGHNGVGGSAASSGAGGWQDLVERANGCVAKKDWKTLAILGSLLSKREVDAPWGPYYLSVAAEQSGSLARAMWLIDLAQKKASGLSGLLYYQRAKIWVRYGEVNKAMADFAKAAEIEPGLSEAHLYLASIYHRDQEPEKAAEAYRLALKENKKNIMAINGLADIRMSQTDSGALDEAADLYKQSLEIDQRQITSWTRLIHIHENLKKNQTEALAVLKNLKVAAESGNIREKLDFDVKAKIRSLEDSIKAAEAAKLAPPQQQQPAGTGTAGTAKPGDAEKRKPAVQNKQK